MAMYVLSNVFLGSDQLQDNILSFTFNFIILNHDNKKCKYCIWISLISLSKIRIKFKYE